MENQSTVELLGGAGVFNFSPTTGLDWVRLVREGFPFECASQLAGQLCWEDSQLANMLDMSLVTLAKRRRSGLLTTGESVKVLRIARTLARATEVFQAAEAAVDWLNHPNFALDGVTPLSLLDTVTHCKVERSRCLRTRMSRFSRILQVFCEPAKRTSFV